jgi:type I restriction enzyme S subunit
MESKHTKLLNIGSVSLLGDGAHTKVERLNNGIYYFSAQNIKKGYIDYSNSSFISELDYNRLFSASSNSIRDLQENDILFSIIGTIGNLYKYRKSDKFGVSSSVAILRPKTDIILPDYLFWVLRSKYFADIINKRKGGSVQGYTNLPVIRDTVIPIPDSIDDQIKIVGILNLIDSKIELNNRINAELEALAKTLYDYWFVQFDFPNAKGKPYKASGGKMVYNEELKREIPDGWEVKHLIDFCSKIGDGIHGTPIYVDYSDYSFINGNNLKDGFIDINTDTKKVSAKEYEKYFLELNEGTILLSINGTIGNLAVFTDEKVMLGKSASYINCTGNNRPYCYQYLKLESIQKKFWNIATGSTIKNLSLESIKNLVIPYPGIELIKKYYDFAKPIDDKRKYIYKENQQLAELRDWLLPMLMNGQVTVGNSKDKEEFPMAAEPKGVYKKIK